MYVHVNKGTNSTEKGRALLQFNLFSTVSTLNVSQNLYAFSEVLATSIS